MEWKITAAKLSGELPEKTLQPKGQIVFRQGEKDRFLYFIEKGIVKAYYTTPDGKEFIKSFLTEGDVIGNMSSLVDNTENTFSVECLEDTTLYKIDFSEFMKKAREEIETAAILNSGLINLAIKKEKREYEFLCLSAADRYLSLIDSMPGIISRVTQNDIARYLGITPVALSRIRSNLGRK